MRGIAVTIIFIMEEKFLERCIIGNFKSRLMISGIVARIAFLYSLNKILLVTFPK